MSSDTPETDTELKRIKKNHDIFVAREAEVLADFTRNLERQRNELRQLARELRDALEKQACETAYYNGHSDGYKQHPNGCLFWQAYLCNEASDALTKATKLLP